MLSHVAATVSSVPLYSLDHQSIQSGDEGVLPRNFPELEEHGQEQTVQDTGTRRNARADLRLRGPELKDHIFRTFATYLGHARKLAKPLCLARGKTGLAG